MYSTLNNLDLTCLPGRYLFLSAIRNVEQRSVRSMMLLQEAGLRRSVPAATRGRAFLIVVNGFLALNTLIVQASNANFPVSPSKASCFTYIDRPSNCRNALGITNASPLPRCQRNDLLLVRSTEQDEMDSPKTQRRRRIRDMVKSMARNLSRPVSSEIIERDLRDAPSDAIDETKLHDAIRRKQQDGAITDDVEVMACIEAEATSALDVVALARTTTADAFFNAEGAIADAQKALDAAREALTLAKTEAAEGIALAEQAAAEALISAQKATALSMKAATSNLSEIESQKTDGNETAQIPVEKALELSYEDVGYHRSEMAPPFIDQDSCLVPGDVLVRVEKAPENSRRIFAGIDIPASVDDVWSILTDYENLQNVVPNLVVNEVLKVYDGREEEDMDKSNAIEPSLPDEVQCENLSKRMKGALLKQVGGARVVGINFSARTTLEVREWPSPGLPDFAHYYDADTSMDRERRARESKKESLKRYRFPRPFALTKLQSRDITMQSIADDDGEFRLYQGVWRMQPLPGCAPEGEEAMRLTYAVEISPRPYLPVALIEGRITQDLCNNLCSIREFVQGQQKSL